ncbi:hypothetical protein SPF06_21560 [Sinomonas sp. JGH33]|uniref:Uncharacterized protein n=1 Tax=Sinomonas terricola TaxID=3110330 RepID=A0ABU5TCH2_9MICC|nr:hypothetical protein [Sinomonas sp. JGH33]MEA5457313.1 hypothetical protein [Sinomonas sp. JGH33]
MSENPTPEPADDDILTARAHLASAAVHLNAAIRALEDIEGIIDTTDARDALRATLERLKIAPEESADQ